MKKIIVAIDGSENSMKALDRAIETTKKETATLIVVNVA